MFFGFCMILSSLNSLMGFRTHLSRTHDTFMDNAGSICWGNALLGKVDRKIICKNQRISAGDTKTTRGRLRWRLTQSLSLPLFGGVRFVGARVVLAMDVQI